MPTILLIEDESELARVAQSYLEKAGFAVLSAARGDSGLSLFNQAKPDLVLLDLNLPGMDGLDVARAICRKGDTPVIMVTGQVCAVLRRSSASGAPAAPRRIQEGDVEIDFETHSASRAGVPLELTPTEFNLLAALAAQPGRVFNRLQLLEAVQGSAYEGYERSVDAHIRNLRAKLEPDPRQPRYIKTVFGVGYRFAKR